MNKFSIGLLFFLIGVVCVPVGVYAWFRYGNPPVAVADPPLPFEKDIVHVPLHARIQRDMPTGVPFAATPAVFVAGAAVYQTQCAFCHGWPQKSSEVGPRMYPSAPQLWKSHRAGVVGVSDDPPGATYWKVKNGIRLAGMPSFQGLLTEQQMWQVSLLVANADKPMPAEVQKELQPAQ